MRVKKKKEVIFHFSFIFTIWEKLLLFKMNGNCVSISLIKTQLIIRHVWMNLFGIKKKKIMIYWHLVVVYWSTRCQHYSSIFNYMLKDSKCKLNVINPTKKNYFIYQEISIHSKGIRDYLNCWPPAALGKTVPQSCPHHDFRQSWMWDMMHKFRDTLTCISPTWKPKKRKNFCKCSFNQHCHWLIFPLIIQD